ncbi:squalene synthase HpnC [Hydrogenophaga sp.]|uniref:squalene synthase HpnC n=1 Tax=Hydrogenophaga sp. TaxID=1904254 RepID=UPI0025C06832|nr:squalene synthase HpnC [Hydrogenophaga sp.]
MAPVTAGGSGAFGASVDHYENFPVASWLCPAHLRPAIAAIYRFARLADDIADEGDASASERLAALSAYRTELDAALRSEPTPHWPRVFGPLALAVHRHGLDPALLHDLISAFEQDVRHTDGDHRYADLAELLRYCALSANPVGRLLLQLWGVRDPLALERSDQICSALQLINFWQDLSVDLPRQRVYLPSDVLRRHGAQVADFLPGSSAADLHRHAVVAELCAHARGLMQMGAPLVHQVAGRAGWELRLVVQGGLRVLDHIADIHHRSWAQRVSVGKADLPVLLWRALWM